jgi:transcriptional regulator with XRE-family HTH domain
MQAQDWFKNQVNELKETSNYKIESLQLKIIERVLELLENRGLTKGDLAQRLNCSKPYITKLLNGGENLTIKKMVEIAVAIDCNLDIDFIPKEYIPQKFIRLTNNKIKPDQLKNRPRKNAKKKIN